MNDKPAPPRRCRLYLITPQAFEPPVFAGDLAAALSAGDVACMQLRLKDVADETIMDIGQRLMPITQDFGSAFILNDRPDLAARLDADGVHIGQDDATYSEARKTAGPGKIVGVTCHDSRHLAMEAGERGADYIAFGAFYPTETKDAKTRAEPELLEWWQALMEVPCVAIGGITLENAEPLVRAGADFLAVSAGIWKHPKGPAFAVEQFNALFDRIAAEQK